MKEIEDTRGIVKILLSEFIFNIGDTIRIGWVSSMRTILSKVQKYSHTYCTYALLENNYNTVVHIYDKNGNTIATADIPMPYYHEHSEVLVFRQTSNFNYPIGMCRYRTDYIMDKCVEI